MTSSATLGIIGGGSVSVAFLHHLTEALADGAPIANGSIRILVFEPRETIGRGSAYERDLDSNLLNVTVGAMSASGSDKGHFKRWLAAHGIESFNGRPIHASSFVSRPLFGRYLESVQENAVLLARSMGITVEHVPSAVDGITQLADGAFHISTRSAGDHTVQHAVLSIGNLDSTNFPEFRQLPQYYASPYPTSALGQGIEQDATVCILGTSLSAVDAIVALAAQGHRGKIYAVSRNGRLPSVRGIHNQPYRLRQELRSMFANLSDRGETLPLDIVIATLHAELRAALAGSDAENLRGLIDTIPEASAFLDEEIALASSRPRQWQAFGNALNEIIDLLWNVLTPEDRHRFNREIRPAWMSRRVTFPLENALVLNALIKSGQLEVHGGFSTLEHDPSRGKFDVHLSAGSISADNVVNATSFSCDAEQSDLPVLRNLLDSGLAMAHPFGGLRVDFSTGRVAMADGRYHERLTALGSMVSGTYFWTNAMEVNARLAMDQAKRLAHAWKRAMHGAHPPTVTAA